MPQRTIAVVDGNSLIHRAFHALPETMTAPDGRPTNAAFGFVSMLVKMVQDLAPDGVVVAFDKGKPAFRMEALEQYKVHRPPTAHALKDQFPMVKKLVDAMGIPMVEIEGWEGDDILGTLARRGDALGLRILLVTGDRDAFQLVSDSVQVVTTKKGLTDIAVYGPAEVEERYGITPAQVPDYLGLKGDTSDNIPGVPGVGEKTAAKLLQQYGSLDEVIAHADEIKGKLGENLRANIGAAIASRTVATITCDVDIDLDMESLSFGDFDQVKLAEAFGELRFTTLLERVLTLSGGGGRTGAGLARATAANVAAGAPQVATLGAPQRMAAAPCKLRACVTGAPALGEVDSLVAEGGWLGVAVDSAGETLFEMRRDVAISGAERTAVASGPDADEALQRVLAQGRVAAADIKALLAELCPPDSSVDCDLAPQTVAAARLFDCGIACYLLESHRSSYELAAIHPDYLGLPLPEPSEEIPRAAIESSGVADLTIELERRLAEDGSLDVFRDIEMPLIPVLAEMERVGVGVDIGVLAELSAKAIDAIDGLRSEIYGLAGTEFTIDSPKQLGEILFEKLGLPTQRKTKTGFSTDAGVLAALAPLHPIAEKIVSYRELTKLKSTYIDALPRMLGADDRLHTSFNQTVAATGRLSSSNPNLQNIPVRTELGRRIRAAFIPAQPGDVMVSADYSQIELRILAHLSGDQGLIDAFTSGEDFHAATAARVFGVPLDAVEPGMRARAKAVNFGIVYGQSAHGLSETLKIPHVEAQTMIDRYYAAYPRVRAYLDETVAEAHRTGYACTMFGRKRRIPELRSGNYNLKSFGERTAMNHPMQGTAADVMKLAMIEVARRLKAEGFASRMVLQVHDELVFEAPVAEVEALTVMICDAMSGVAPMAVPLDVSVSSGPDWASAK